jgi:hypothetical protein
MSRLETLEKLKQYVSENKNGAFKYVNTIEGEKCFCALGYIAKVNGATDELLSDMECSSINTHFVDELGGYELGEEFLKIIESSDLTMDELGKLQRLNDIKITNSELVEYIDELMEEGE